MKTILSLDIGEKRIGVARAPLGLAIASPYKTLKADQFDKKLTSLLKEEDAAILVIGLPRGMQGQETAHTKQTREQIDEIKKSLDIPVFAQDETGTSLKAKEELADKKKGYTKEDVDALAATYILQDFIDTHEQEIRKAMEKNV